MSIFSSTPLDLCNEPKVLRSSPAHLLSFCLFFSRFCLFGLFLLICFVVFFYKYISTINSKKVMCFQRKDGILNMWINNLNFYYFLQFTVGKPALITI